jgi:aldose 1-epimerase
MPDITAHDFHLSLSPEHGGCVDRLDWRGHEVLFPTSARANMGTAHPTERAGFPMVPFAGRISESRFAFEGVKYALTPNFLPEPNAIHGFGWHMPWQVETQTERDVTLVLEHDTDQWPASYLARQTFRLTETAFELDMSLTNTGARAMPAGLGWHPYFAASGAHVQSQISAIWRPENAAINAQPEPLDETCNLNTDQLVARLRLDHCFTATTPDTRITWPSRRLQVRMTASDIFSHFVIYTPQGDAFFCAEPISHVPDAVNLAKPADETGLRILKPDETLTGTIRLEPSTL